MKPGFPVLFICRIAYQSLHDLWHCHCALESVDTTSICFTEERLDGLFELSIPIFLQVAKEVSLLSGDCLAPAIPNEFSKR